MLEAGARFEDEDFADTSWDLRALPVPPRGRLLRHPADRRAQGLPDPVRRRRRRRVAGLREHALRAARRRSTTTRSGATSPTGAASSRRTTTRPSGCSASSTNPLAHPRRRRDGEGRRRHGRRRHVPPDPGRRVLRRPGQAAGEQVADPYFGGAGPERNACLGCGECMTGCRHNAKNTLVKNYLYLAEQAGAVGAAADHGHPGRARATAAGTTYSVRYTKAKRRGRSATRTLTAEQVVFSAAALGTQRLLHRMKRRGPPAAALRAAGLPVAHQLRVDPRRDRPGHARSTTARAWRSPPRSTPTSTPTSSRCATARAATPCR